MSAATTSPLKAKEVVWKHPNEALLVDFDFGAVIRGPAALTGTPTITASPTGPTISGQVASGKIAQCKVAGGVDGTTYLLECYVGTDDGETRILCGELKVEECASA